MLRSAKDCFSVCAARLPEPGARVMPRLCGLPLGILLLVWIWTGMPVLAQGRPDVGPAELVRKARSLLPSSPREATPFAEQAVAAARAAGPVEEEVRALLALGECRAAFGQHDQAEKLFRQALDLSRDRNQPRLTAEARFRLSRALVSLDRYEEVVSGYLEAIPLAETAGDGEFSAVITDHLGIAHFVLRNREKAMQLCRQAESVLKTSADRSLYAENLQHIGIIYTGDGRWAEALDCFRRVLEIRETISDPVALIGALGNVALALHGLKRDEEALAPLSRALVLSSSSEDPRLEPFLLLRRGRALQALGRNAQAAADFDRALELDRALGNKRRLASTLSAAAAFYRHVPGRESRAIAALEEVVALNKSLYDEDSARRVHELQERFDAERRQKQIELLERDQALSRLEASRARQFRMAGILVFVMLAGGLAFALVRYRAQVRTSRQLRQALQKVRTLQGLLPICAHCKKIRNDKGYWQQVESYIGQHSEARFSHGICPDCVEHHYPEYRHLAGRPIEEE